MSRLSLVNYITAGFIILMAVVSLREAYSTIQRYGWSYTQIVTIDGDTTESVVSVGTLMFAILFLGVMGGLFAINGSVVNRSLVLDIRPLAEGEETGITFPRGQPESWDLGVDLRTRVIDVTLNDITISFPLTKILGWVEQHEKEKMGEMK